MNDRQLTTDERRRIRARKLLDKWFPVLVVLLIALVVLGGWLAYEPLAAPGTEARETTVGSFEEEGRFSHQAEIQQSTSVYEEGETVRNRPAYYTQIAPELEGTYEYAYQANDGSLDVVMDAYVVIQSVDDDGNEYWRTTESLERQEVEGVSPEDPVSVSYAVNVTELQEEMEAIESELGASAGDTESKVVVETTANGTVGGQERTDRHTAEAALNVDSGTYSVETNVSDLADEEFTETSQVEREYSPFRAYGPLGLAAVSLFGLIGLVNQRLRGTLEPTEAELAALAAAQQREEFGDWISTGRFPEADVDDPCVTVDSLEDIVDVAIDCDGRVIEDGGNYYVPSPGVYYAYRPDDPGDGTETDSERPPNAVTLLENDPSTATADGTPTGNGQTDVTGDGQTEGEATTVGETGAGGGTEREVDADGGRPLFDE